MPKIFVSKWHVLRIDSVVGIGIQIIKMFFFLLLVNAFNFLFWKRERVLKLGTAHDKRLLRFSLNTIEYVCQT